MAVDGIVGAQYMIDQLGKSYSDADCVHAAVINLIRNCPGGDKSYRTAGCTELWNSINKSGKYHHITECMTLADAKNRGMLIGDLPVIYNSGSNVCEHIAYYMGGYGGYECIHSSASKGCVCATYLKNGFTHVLRHRDITGRDPSSIGGNDYAQNTTCASTTNKEGVTVMNVIYKVLVATQGGALNLRTSPSTSSKVLTEIPFGTEIGVVEDTNSQWLRVAYNNLVGYVSRQYTSVVSAQEKPNNTDYDGKPNSGEYPEEGSWGVFVPCVSEEDAKLLASYFLSGFACKHDLND